MKQNDANISYNSMSLISNNENYDNNIQIFFESDNILSPVQKIDTSVNNRIKCKLNINKFQDLQQKGGKIQTE